MKVIIKRSIVIPQRYLKRALNTYYLVLPVRTFKQLGLDASLPSAELLEGSVTVFIGLFWNELDHSKFVLDESSNLMLQHSFNASNIPDQLGLVLLEVDGLNDLFLVSA